MHEESEIAEKLRMFEETCRKNGLKVTPQRVAVYHALVATDIHPTAEEVCRMVRQTISNISLDTVNRTLLTLNEIGAAFTVIGSGDARRYDGGLDEHQHFKCVKCKRIIDFHHKPFDNMRLPARISKKYKVLRKTVYIEGLCDLCR